MLVGHEKTYSCYGANTISTTATAKKRLADALHVHVVFC